MLSMYSEGIQLAQRMERDGGYKAFLLNYRIAPTYAFANEDDGCVAGKQYKTSG